MNAIIYNHQYSTIKPYEEDMAFKAAYVFATMIVATGNSNSSNFLKHIFTEDASLKRQLFLLETNPYLSPEWKEIVAYIPGLRKEFKKWNEIKHPTKAMLVSRKKLLDSIKANYLLMRNHLLSSFSSQAFLILGDLLTEENYAWIDSNKDNPELHDDTYTCLSSVLTSPITKENLEQGVLFLLTDNFFLSQAAASLKVQENLEGLEETSPYLVSLFRFPDLNQYQKQEIQSLRQGLLVQLTLFAGAVDEWTAGFAQEENETAQKQKMEQVYTSAKAVGQELKAHILVQQTSIQERQAELVIGAVPATVVWKYFREVNAIPEETWEVLSNNGEGEKLCPVMALRYFDRANFYVEKENEELLVPALKKSLPID